MKVLKNYRKLIKMNYTRTIVSKTEIDREL